MRRHGRSVSSAGQLSLPLFIEELQASGPRGEGVRTELLRLAGSVLARLPACSMTAEDLASELTLRLLERVRRGKAALSDARDVRAVLRYRLYQIATEQNPARSLLKELSAHVRRILADGFPPAAPRPDAIERRGRLEHARVRAAVGWALAEADAPADPRHLCRWLAREYNLLAEAVPLDGVEHLGSSDPNMGGLRLARRLAARLGREGVELLKHRLEGETLQEVGARLGGSTTRAFGRIRELEARLSEETAAMGGGEPQLRAALQLIAACSDL